MNTDNGNKQKDNQRPNYHELEDKNTFYDITGNMNIWRVHETYEGSGNIDVRDDILRNKKTNNPLLDITYHLVPKILH